MSNQDRKECSPYTVRHVQVGGKHVSVHHISPNPRRLLSLSLSLGLKFLDNLVYSFALIQGPKFKFIYYLGAKYNAQINPILLYIFVQSL